MGILDAQLIEQAVHEDYQDQMVLAPSYLVREAWEIPEFREFWAIAVSNLLDKSERDEHSLYKKMVDASFKLPEKAEWNITNENINKEKERNNDIKVSFYFVLKWLQFEIAQKKESGD